MYIYIYIEREREKKSTTHFSVQNATGNQSKWPGVASKRFARAVAPS